jgi:hypothetical protein
VLGLTHTLSSFVRGLRRIIFFHKEHNKRQILKTSLILLVTAESCCIATAATIDFVLYQYSIFISIPVSLAAGTIAVAAPHALRQAKRSMNGDSNNLTTQSHLDGTSKLINIKSLGHTDSSKEA